MQKVYIGKHRKLFKGVFAAKDIKEGEIVIVFTGKKYHADRTSMLPFGMQNHALQIGLHTWLYSRKCLDMYVNHSCNQIAASKD